MNNSCKLEIVTPTMITEQWDIVHLQPHSICPLKIINLIKHIYQTLSLFPNNLTLLRCVTALSTAYSSPISTSAVPGIVFINFT